VRYGFAARCEATALPRRNEPFPVRAMPLVWALPLSRKSKIIAWLRLRPSQTVEEVGAQPEPGA
jgi:hypothetical protein